MVVDFDEYLGKSLRQLCFIPENEPFGSDLRNGKTLSACEQVNFNIRRITVGPANSHG